MDDQYAIVEFNDGLQMIPSSWLTKDKKQAYWPTFTSTERFSKAVQKCIPKMDSWPLYEVKRILATANKYETGMIKLKKAEFISDINSESDDETSKRNRKYRAKTVLSSDEISSNEEENIVKVPSYPKVPSSKVQKKNNNMESNKNPVNKIFKSKDVLKQIENENINLSTTTPSKKSIETNIHLKKTSVERHDSINNTEHDFNHNIKSAHDPQAYFKTDSVNTYETTGTNWWDRH
ncbi:uncharacterized protein LOC114936032 isoform X1 [Nylanderia fulva]|uniref:uncharacterized protein LOC114936032 isoform X1 n=1 Tax=Nylanderia fulva TaxID=613905 RepID=UPI0010FB36D0|nr:uncharacterized protein LOC114936032 isoform X1 [Nylanderia fulva]XP_029164840.1 uncharacterized protein LOC114936032 isoform X1 [Nylanderia fulva]XP_029164850.1 uncharacterized protein LOC114936032 isoform X1 [Nylanderia fulva]XP_029164858.1 uncharacterized protein LOC114936032 isoform X1 [Nylanderia fulva]XP_029164868.1 uncharacterized protein LOC114936032 isoform X1 [Nylanderia fulva]